MKVRFKHLGTILTSADPLVGYYAHDYLCEDMATGCIERIRDDDYLSDGIYDVEDGFFDKYTPQEELEENEW